MILTPHLLVGAAVGTQTTSIFAAFAISLASHYVFDFLPHWDYLEYLDLKNKFQRIKILLELCIVAIIAFLILWVKGISFVIVAGMIGALLPDAVEFLYHGFKIKPLKRLSVFHNKIHSKIRLSFWQGILSYIIISGTALLIIFA